MTGRWTAAIAFVILIVVIVGSSVDDCAAGEGCSISQEVQPDQGQVLLQTASASARILAKKLQSQSLNLQEAARKAQETQVQVQELAHGLFGVLENTRTLQDAVQKAKQSQADQAIQEQQVAQALTGAVVQVQQSEQFAEQDVKTTGQIAQQLQTAMVQTQKAQQANDALISSADKTTNAMNAVLQQLQLAFGAGLAQDPRLRDTLAAVQDALNAQGAASHTSQQQSAGVIQLLQDVLHKESLSISQKQETTIPLLKNGLERLQLVQTSHGDGQAAVAGVLQMLESVMQDLSTKQASGEGSGTAASRAVSSLQSVIQKMQVETAETAREVAELQETATQSEASIMERLEEAEHERDQYAEQQHRLMEQLAQMQALQGTVEQSRQHEELMRQHENQMSQKLDEAEEARDALAAQVSQMRREVQGAMQEKEASKAWHTAQEAKDAQLATLLQSAMQVTQAKQAGMEEQPTWSQAGLEEPLGGAAVREWTVPAPPGAIDDKPTGHPWSSQPRDDRATDHPWTVQPPRRNVYLDQVVETGFSRNSYFPTLTPSRQRTEH
eukprot:gnl/TRDRNA2_/TRDRNA2_191373_c0_seq1.p1 gnl/TRDRNA2_/TRDRNA2_191373_c0~~gnl/TRDRNA2_/TRDRNA2_191373_c0_seq1.p1  ORF type:complete len:555 (-),score=132.37 gnl/TRDRNA2_/TRDRNA2_191373_c0_seq1:92-1756(-)